MSNAREARPSLVRSFQGWWRETYVAQGLVRAFRSCLLVLWTFLRESTPASRRQRYGDMEYDWDYRVDTTSAAVGWRDRLLGLLHSPYQPSEPALFHEMLHSVPIDYQKFTFVDVGSGKGRALLMAADYPFQRIVGVELLPELHRIAQDNLRKYSSATQRCFNIESQCANARTFEFPQEPIMLYLFNPLPQPALQQMLNNLEHSLHQYPREVYLLYHNPLLEHVLSRLDWLEKRCETHQYCVYAARFTPQE